MIVKVRRSLESLRVLQNLKSIRFTMDETAEYLHKLMREIERKVTLIGSSSPFKEENYQGTYRVVVDHYKVYYSVNNDETVAYIESVKLRLSNA